MTDIRATAKETALAFVQHLLDRNIDLDHFAGEIGGASGPARENRPAYRIAYGFGRLWDTSADIVPLATVKKGEVGVQLLTDPPDWGVWKLKALAAELTTPQLKLF